MPLVQNPVQTFVVTRKTIRKWSHATLIGTGSVATDSGVTGSSIHIEMRLI